MLPSSITISRPTYKSNGTRSPTENAVHQLQGRLYTGPHIQVSDKAANQEYRQLTRARNFDQAIITVKVGAKDNQEPFSCHKELLRRCSTHFEQCLQQVES